ncbi:MAG TPA: hypothetical protein V6D07_18670 [Trichocoleus sp.]
MRVLLANHKGWFFHHWNAIAEDAVGHLWSPSPTPVTIYPHVIRACDNGRYAAVVNGSAWSEEEFLAFAKQEARRKAKPLWITVPDIPFDAAATLREWDYWEPKLRGLGVPLAMCVQDGMTPEDTAPADVIFIGGSDGWRWQPSVIPEFIDTGKFVHVGRINGNKLWVCDRLGVDSCDGTGWFRGDQQQLAKLEYYLRCRVGQAIPPPADVDDPLAEPSLALTYYRRWFQQPQRPTTVNTDPIMPEHIEMAMRHWVPVPTKRLPTRYVVEHEGKLYPPKELIAQANFWARGSVLHPRYFLGGQKAANRFLDQRGFKVRQATREEIKTIETTIEK